MPNFFTDNKDIVFQFENLDLEYITELTEDGYKDAGKFDYAPKDYNEAKENYRKVMEIAGDISGNIIAPLAAEVDEEGAHFEDGVVTYAKGTQEALKRLSQADLMGFTLPRKYGGLNMPMTIYTMSIEMVSRADASLMNLYGLQDIGETINKFAKDEQKDEFLPQFSDGSATGAMVLTEPDAGSDLQAVNLKAYQDEDGNWKLNGVKRFITNGSGDILLVLARSEPGTIDGRGLSMFVCYGDDTVVVRRIENKLGIHGSPTCELQFNDTPCQLIGKRKLGLIKYVMDLMNGARLGVSAQAMGISQAAYEEALSYAKAREQFGKAIIEIPAVKNLLIDMRTTLGTNRSLLYATAKSVDMRDKLIERIEHLKAEGKPAKEEMELQKKYNKIAALLTPMCKFILTESANKITYDSLQIHGGTGYMKEFSVERLARDARITNIYEGTSQLQVVAAIGGVINDLYANKFDEYESKNYNGQLADLTMHLKKIRKIYKESLSFVQEKNDETFQNAASKDLVEMYSYLITGYLLIDEAEKDDRKLHIAKRYILRSLAACKQNSEAIKLELYSDLQNVEDIVEN
ncbi:MAG: acyl-CoA dehydrogenase family protein [Candidatus Marinimicrobia bacterium]|nr:acyl-CoA dehydrogenase family protein [Candidatus Neomarinimicrobiota bacterium]